MHSFMDIIYSVTFLPHYEFTFARLKLFSLLSNLETMLKILRTELDLIAFYIIMNQSQRSQYSAKIKSIKM